MTLKINFIFVCEGPSDTGLIPHLEALCVNGGADEAIGIFPDLGRLPYKVGKSVSEKTTAALKLEPNIDIVFIHRDSDSADPEPRYNEIRKGMEKLAIQKNYVAVIPVQETEAWLLLDEASIRNVAENPRGKIRLGLPSLTKIESTANPKEILKAAIAKASETSGKRLRKINNNFSGKCRRLLELLDIDGNINKLKSWQRLTNDINKAINGIIDQNS